MTVTIESVSTHTTYPVAHKQTICVTLLTEADISMQTKLTVLTDMNTTRQIPTFVPMGQGNVDRVEEKKKNANKPLTMTHPVCILNP